MGKGIGYGKTILFGEMFAIFGIPVIASALSMTADAEVVQTASGGWDIRDERREAKGYKEEKKGMQIESLERIFRHLRFRPEHLRIRLGGDLPAMSGIGATGASSVAIVRALSEEFNLRLTDDEVNAGAYQAEIAYHGPTTSGIDNMVSTYGGIICLTRGEPNVVRKMKLKEPVEVVIGDTGIIANTKSLLAALGERKKNISRTVRADAAGGPADCRRGHGRHRKVRPEGDRPSDGPESIAAEGSGNLVPGAGSLWWIYAAARERWEPSSPVRGAAAACWP